MESYSNFQMPESIVYGRDALEKVGKEASIRGDKALIISDKIMDKLGYVNKCRDYLKEDGIDCEVYLGVDSEPTDKHVAESLALFQECSCDIVISLGGGSCIDTAKAVVVLATNGGYIGDYMGNKKVANITPIPHIAIPTSAGTGSEATDVTVITNTTSDVKMMIKQPAFLPTVGIADPVLTKTSPKNVTAATGVDTLTHALEAYLSKKAQPMTDTIALSAMKLVVENLLTAYNDGDNIDAREAMSLAALQGGMAFSNASVSLVHGMSRPIGALFNVPHGMSNAMLLPAVLEYSKDESIDRLADLGRIFSTTAENMSNEEAANYAVASVKELCLSLNIPNLKEWGINREEFENATKKMSIDALDSGSPSNNPKVPSQKEIEELYHICYDYQFSS